MSLTPNVEMDLTGLKPVEVSVKLWNGKKYVLKEASEGATTEHQDEMFRVTKPDMATGKPSNLMGMGQVDCMLVARCLFERTDTGDVPLTLEEVMSWPSRAVKKLRDKVREISDMRSDPKSIDEQIAALQKQKALSEDAAKNE